MGFSISIVMSHTQQIDIDICILLNYFFNCNKSYCVFIIGFSALWCGPRIASLPLPRYVVRGD